MTRLLKWMTAALLGYALILPLFMLLRASVTSSPYASETVLTGAGFRRVLGDPGFYAAFGTSLVLSVLTAIGSLVLGTLFAVIATRFAVPLRRWVTPMMIIITAIPGLFYAMSWSMLANSNSGLIAKGLAGLGLGEWSWFLNAVSWPGLVIVSVMKVTGFAYLFLIGPIGAADRSQEDAAVIFGASRMSAFFTVTLPSLAPAYFAAGMLLLVFGIQTFDMPAVLGVPVGITPLSVLVNDYLIVSTRPDWAAASATAVLTTLFVILLVAIQMWVLKGKDFVSLGGKSQNGAIRAPRRFGWVVTAIIAAYALIALAAPMTQFAMGAFQPFFGLYGNWTLNNFATVLGDRNGMNALFNTVMIVALAAPTAVLAGFLMAYAMARAPVSLLGILSRIGSWVPATMPGIVLSVALLATFIKTPGLQSLFGTPWLMALALIVGAIPLSVRAAEGMVAQVAPDLENAARIAGAGPVASTLGITARLCAPALAGAWLLVSLWMAGTLDVPMLLQSSRSQTIATYSYSLFSNGQTPEAAAIFLLFVAAMMLLVAALALALAILRAALRAQSRSVVPPLAPVAHGANMRPTTLKGP